jgi:prepilin-type N-terminal cleavage/methylation domain-containing protein
MLDRHSNLVRNRARVRAFTLVELLVVIAIIGILVALLLPAIQAAREAARRSSCQNNIKNLALAVLNYADQRGGLPPTTDARLNGQLIANLNSGMQTSWLVYVLPYIEEQALYDQWNFDVNIFNQDINLRPEERQPELLLCPSDEARGRYYVPTGGANRRYGKGNYAAYVSPEHIQSMRIYPGAMINESQPLQWITDGTSKTLLLAEIRTREVEQDVRGVWAPSWAGGCIISFDMHSSDSAGTAIIVSAANGKRNAPYVPILYPGVDSLTPNSPPTATNEDWIRDCDASAPYQQAADLELMPCHPESATRSAAAPRSLHLGGVNSAHVDGSVTWLADEIDSYLMARMVSINDNQGNIEGYQKY